MRCGFKEIGFQDIRFDSRKGVMIQTAIYSFILSHVAVCRGIVSLMRITAFCTITGVWSRIWLHPTLY